MKKCYVFLIFASILCSCAHQKLTGRDAQFSEKAIQTAEKAGAAATPEASEYLVMAQQQLAEARDLIKSDRRNDAALILLRAEADAELAAAITKNKKEKAAADTTRDNVEKLKKALQ